jgi:hypothetical protein
MLSRIFKTALVEFGPSFLGHFDLVDVGNGGGGLPLAGRRGANATFNG